MLHTAVEYDAQRCVSFLIQHYPDLMHRYDSVLHENPAHKAAKCLRPEILARLRKSGARLDLENIEDDTAQAMALDNTRWG